LRTPVAIGCACSSNHKKLLHTGISKPAPSTASTHRIDPPHRPTAPNAIEVIPIVMRIAQGGS
ncbi:MAG TPA: hypothetical protein PKW66_27510, partial [Polyangiaceae bacterium]|nr:hypothetical protein [Polyangiaceae bacterium]